ncbi:hypothetical protein ElyMa_002976400 [Elysia marginata]|uniref:Uncharacterized protein n=1 Tax=Elysia marginata TaxID=1093978 RepID=A0AAV4IC14_9GAST|nr:hypothetical protein ElyMa_002976400 [Elysia marginata]
MESCRTNLFENFNHEQEELVYTELQPVQPSTSSSVEINGIQNINEHKRGKHGNRPNKLPDGKKQEVLDFLDSLPKYWSHYTRRHNPNRFFLSPALTQNKLHELYVEKCASQAVEPVSNRMFSEIFVTGRNYHFGQPSLDTYKTCDSFEMESKGCPLDQNIKLERELHLRKAEAAQLNMKQDLEAPKNQ